MAAKSATEKEGIGCVDLIMGISFLIATLPCIKRIAAGIRLFISGFMRSVRRTGP
jgi:hypothetical protein